MKLSLVHVISCVVLLISASVQAALQDRGNGLVYDDILDITWLQDANLPLSETFGISGYAQSGNYAGMMNYATALQWLQAMNDIKYKGFNNWRLPSVNPVNGVSFSNSCTPTGACDTGYNIGKTGTVYAGTTASELAYMYYTNLGNDALIDTNGSKNTTTCTNSHPYCLQNTALFSNLAPDSYWTNQPSPFTVNTGQLPPNFAFYMRHGNQSDLTRSGFSLLWPVLDGDAANAVEPRSVPVLTTPSLLFLTLVLLSFGITAFSTRHRLSVH